jgi:cytoskeleton protein RodZ
MNELGEWLIRAREARGLTIEDAERDTRISRRYLQALESGDLDVIPAPVYARGFLRSYAQYLGLDPQEAMARYPRDDGPPGYTPPQRTAPPQPQHPIRSAQRPSGGPFGPRNVPPAPRPQQQGRPEWRRPGPGTAPGGRPGAPPVPLRQAEPEHEPGPRQGHEPTIGVDIGVPVPARKIQQDPAAQTRGMIVLIVAAVVIGGVLLLAFLISNLGGDDDGGLVPPGDQTGTNGAIPGIPDDNGDANGNGEPDPVGNGGPVGSGVVPDVEGENESFAIEAIEAAGLVPNVRYEPHDGTPGIVLTQSPAAGTQREPGDPVTIIVSEAP